MRKLFTNDVFFLITAICTVIVGTLFALFTIYAWEFSFVDFSIIMIRVCCGIVLYVAYKKHNKEIVKGMMGSLLMVQLIGSILNFSLFGIDTISTIFTTILFVLTVGLFANHFIINSNNTAKPGFVYLNQIFVLLIILTNTIWIIIDMCIYSHWMNIVADILDWIAYGGVLCIIVCVESRLDAYRLIRDKNSK